MAAGGALDFCIIGVFDGYLDRAGVAAAKEVFQFHKAHEAVYAHMKPMARVSILRPSAYGHRLYGERNFLGIFRVLKESHIPFTLLSDQQVLNEKVNLHSDQLIIVPNLSDISPDAVIRLHENGIPLLLCGASERLPESLAAELGLQIRETQADTRAAYLSAEGEREKELFPEAHDRGWVLLDKDFGVADAPDWEKLLPQVKKAWFGPPERCFGHELGDAAGILLAPDGKTAVLPWKIGELYHRYGYEDYRYILAGTVQALCPDASLYPVQAPICAEMFWDETDEGMLLQVVNLSGFDGVTFSPSLPVSVQVQLPVSIQRARLLHDGEIELNKGELNLTCTGRYTAVLLS